MESSDTLRAQSSYEHQSLLLCVRQLLMIASRQLQTQTSGWRLRRIRWALKTARSIPDVGSLHA
jgi:hypothetical protein